MSASPLLSSNNCIIKDVSVLVSDDADVFKDLLCLAISVFLKKFVLLYQ